MKRLSFAAVLFLLASLAPGGNAWGALCTWTEVGDAGDHTAPQITIGNGNLTQIMGSIADPSTSDFVDAYQVYYDGAPGTVNIVATFTAETVDLGITLYQLQSGSPSAVNSTSDTNNHNRN